jgi:peptidoglycan/LPS O-acetylase OafA/YrhL
VRPTLHNLQALRGVACLLVFGIHLAVWEQTFGIGRPLLGGFVWFGYAGVDLFFVLSGFLITFTQFRHLGHPAAAPAYLFRRAWRIYPTFWAVMLLGVGLTLAVSGRWAVVTQPGAPGVRTLWLTWLTLAPSRVPNLYVPPAWSLSFEMMFYLAFAGLVVLPRRVGPRLLGGWAVAVGVAAVAVGGAELSTRVWLWHLLSPFVWEFLLGCGAAWAVRAGATRFGRAAAVLGVGWAAAWVLSWADPKDPAAVAGNMVWRVAAFGPAAALLVYGLVALELRGGWRLPRWLRHTGDASYSIYLWHAPAGGAVYALTLTWPHTFLPHLGWLALQCAVGVGGGFVVYRLIERPLMSVVNRRKAGRETPTVIVDRVIGRPADRTRPRGPNKPVAGAAG